MLPVPRSKSIEDRILLLRGEFVMLDRDLATLSRIPTKHLNQQVKRNKRRFPSEFMFQLTDEEAEGIRVRMLGVLGSWRGKLPCAFTELGAGMLSSVLRSPAAARVTIEILRVFKELRQASEPPAPPTLARRYKSLFATIWDDLLLAPEEEPFTTEAPYTYFLQAGENGPIKIGSSCNLLVRLRTLMTMSPLPLALLGVMEGDYEEACHTRFDVFRLHGEWFEPSREVLEFIRVNATMPDGPHDPRV